MSASLQNSTASTPASCSASRSRPTTSRRWAWPPAWSCRGRPGRPGKCTMAMTGLMVPKLRCSDTDMTRPPLAMCLDELYDGVIPRPGILPERGVTSRNLAPDGDGQQLEQLPGQRGGDDDVVGRGHDQI